MQAQAEGAELAAAGEALEIERDALAEQVAALTRERDTLTGKAAQQAAVLAARLEICVATAQETRQAQAERDDARKQAAEAREQAARLAGQLEAWQQQSDKGDKAEAAENPAKTRKGTRSE